MLANPVDQKTLWYKCCRSNLAKLQTAAVSQEEKLSPSKAEFGQLPKVIYSSLLNKISFAVLCVRDTHCSLEGSGCKKTREEKLSVPPSGGKHWKYLHTQWDVMRQWPQSGLSWAEWMLLHGFTVSTWMIKSVPTVGLGTAGTASHALEWIGILIQPKLCINSLEMWPFHLA